MDTEKLETGAALNDKWARFVRDGGADFVRLWISPRCRRR